MFLDISEINILNIESDFFKQYIKFKKECDDAVLLFQIGDFFETFFQDAKIFSEITGITLGSRTVKGIGEVLQAGIPVHCADLYIKKLLNENLKVSLCEQIKNKDGSIFREITRKYTKGTIIENEFLEANENNYILALYNYNDKFEISYADVSTGQFYSACGSYSEIMFEIGKISPNEILIAENQKSKFFELLNNYNVTVLNSEFFEAQKTNEAILKYCIYTQKKYLPKFDEVIEYKINSFLLMDEVTRRNLEIRRTRKNLKKRGSLLSFLNYTKTSMGNRLLKKYLDEPLLDSDLINQRLDAVCEVILNKDKIEAFDNLFEQFCDLARISAKISNSTILPKDLYSIAKNAEIINTLIKNSEVFNSKLLKINRNKASEVSNFLKNVNLALDENSSDILLSGGIIKEGYSSNLDYLKEKLKNVEINLNTFFEHEKKHLDIDKMKLNYSKSIGYSFEIPNSKEKNLTSSYYKKQSLSSVSRYSCEKLQKFEDEISSLKFKINELEYHLYCEIRANAIEFVDSIRLIAKEIARIDVIFSFAKCAIKNNLSRPVFKKENIIIKDGFHPGLIEADVEIVKNDTEFLDDSMIILTGANMSGKSTYLKQNAIICLLAQIGSYVPATCAELSILDRIFVRQGSVDDIVNNSSSFMVEMNDLKFVIENTDKNSLVLLDEPAKSTNAAEGGAITKAFCEFMLANFKAKIMIATHNLELTKLEAKYPNRVFDYVIGANCKAESIGCDRKVVKGIMKSSLAINTAVLAGLPDEIIINARKYLEN